MIFKRSPAVHIRDDRRSNKSGFIIFIIRAVKLYRISRVFIGPEFLPLPADIVSDNIICRVKYMGCGSVVLLKPYRPAILIVVFKSQNIFDISSPEFVNTLIVISDHAKIVEFPGDKAREIVLKPVRILILVDEDIFKPVLPVFQNIRIILKELYRIEQKIVKIHGIGPEEFLTVTGIYLPDADLPYVTDHTCSLAVCFCCDLAVLCPGYFTENGFRRECLVIEIQLLEDLLYKRDGIVCVVYGKTAFKSEPFRIPPQDPYAGAVESTGPDIVCLISQA